MEEKYVINPKFILRNEKKKILICKTDSWTGDIDKYQCFHPVFGILLSLFDGQNNLRDVASLWRYITSSSSKFSEEKNIENIKDHVNFINALFKEDILIKKNRVDNFSVYDPFEFIIEKEHIDLSDFRLSFPLSINYDVTFRCPRRCIYCYSENEFAPSYKYFSTERIKEIIKECHENGVIHITLAGGEPFFKKDIIKDIALILESKINTFVSTKTFLSKRTCARLKEIGLDKIQVSIDSSDEELANYMAGDSRFFEEIKQTIDNLIACGISIRYKSVITSHNVYNVPDLLTFLAARNAQVIHLSLYGRSMYRHKDSLFITNEQAEWLSEKVNEFRRSNSNIEIIYGGWSDEVMTEKEKEKRFNERAIYSAGRSAINILPDGKLLFCEQLPSSFDHFIYGDLSKQSIYDAWNSPKLKELLLPDQKNFRETPCFDCSDYFECNWLRGRCIRDSYHAFKNVYAPDLRCPKVDFNFRMT